MRIFSASECRKYERIILLLLNIKMFKCVKCIVKCTMLPTPSNMCLQKVTLPLIILMVMLLFFCYPQNFSGTNGPVVCHIMEPWSVFVGSWVLQSQN